MINGFIFEGGCIKGLVYVGVLEEFMKYQDIETVKYLGGTSAAGSVVATLLASDYTIQEINEVLYNIDWNTMQSNNFGFVRNTIRLFTKYGYHKGNHFEKFINKMLFAKYKMENMTFIQLFEITKKHLKMVGTNVTKGETIYMDYIYTPDMSIAKAVRISSSVPFMFKPVKIYNELYVNGELTKTSNYAMFDDIENINIIAFDLEETSFKFNKISSLITYIRSVIKILHHEANKSISTKNNVHVCKILENSIDAMKFNLSLEEKNYLKQIGYTSFLSFLYKLDTF